MLRAQAAGELVHAPDQRLGGEATDTENRFANACVAVLLVPLAFVADVVLFPVQIVAGDEPYGDRRS